jgi:uncharacterized protein (TIGR02569 family)
MVPETVLAAFGVPDARPVPLPGGQGAAWRSGEIVLKPAGAPRAARWTAGLYSTLSGPGFRVPRPVRSVGGDWLAEGWAAWQWLPGAPAIWSGVSPRWPELASASRAFHAALAGVPTPGWIGRDGSPWTVADQVAWGERDPGAILDSAGERLGQQLRGLLAALRPVTLAAQLAHGNLGGNVLFADGEPPAVIDFAPCWRPAGQAIAVAAVDALLWSRAHPQILDALADEPELDQLLARALIYRLVSEIVLRDDGSGYPGVTQAGQPVTDLVLARLSGGPRPATYLDDSRLAVLVGRAAGTAVTEITTADTAGQDLADGTVSDETSAGAVGNDAPVAAAVGGHTRAVRRLVRLGDGRTVFVKASGPGADISAEIGAYQAIGPAPFLPSVVALRRDPVPLLILEALPASGWMTRWSAQAVADTQELLVEVHARQAPAGLPSWEDPGAEGTRSWRAIGQHPDRLLRLQVCSQEWLSANLPALARAASGARPSGDRLVHGDVRLGNLCYRGGRLVLADWATAAAGSPWLDIHDWLVAMAAEGGPPPEERQGPGAAGHAALIAADQVLLAPSRDSDRVLFGLRRRRLAVALAWAARLLRLQPPEFP